jgi:hypothetical protein
VGRRAVATLGGRARGATRPPWPGDSHPLPIELARNVLKVAHPRTHGPRLTGSYQPRWDGNASAQLEFNSTARGWETRAGTTPAGSMWRKNPVRPGSGLPVVQFFSLYESMLPVVRESEIGQIYRLRCVGSLQHSPRKYWCYAGPAFFRPAFFTCIIRDL